MFAGAFGWSVTVIAWLACAFLAVVLWFHREALPRTGGDAAFALGLGWTLLQTVPLPWAMGDGQREVRESLRLADSASWTALSLDPGATREQLVVGTTLVAAYLGARVLAHRYGRSVILRWVATSPALVIVVGLLHELVGAESVYGWHAPKFTSPALMGPILNPNHLGGFASFGAVLAAGVALGAKSKATKTSFGAAAALCAAAAIAAGSRGAVLSAVVGLGWVITLAVLRRSEVERRGRWLTLGMIGSATVAAIAYVGLERIEVDFANNDLSKLELFARAAPMVLDHPWWGVGRGAFEPVFAGLTPTSSRFTHPENLVLQWVIEWGIPCTLAIMIWFGRDLFRAARSNQIEVAVAAGAVGAMVLHDQVDFALEMPGIAVVVALCFGAIATSRRESTNAPTLARRALVSTGVVLAAVTILFGSGIERNRPETLMSHLLVLGADGRLEDVRSEVRRAAELHPLDPGVAIHAGFAYRTHDRGASIRWLNRAMQLAPRWASPHVLAAAFLTEMGARDQALLEIREAEQRQLGSTRDILCAIVRDLPAERAMRVLPIERTGRIDLADRLARCLSADEAARLDAIMVAELGAIPRASTRIARRLLASGSFAEALQTLDRIENPDEPAVVLRATIWRSDGNPTEALRALPARPTSWEGRVLRAELAADLGDEPALERELSRLRSSAAGRVDRLAEAWAVAGRIEERRGNLGAAMQAFERAHRLQSASVAHLRSVERLAQRADQAARVLSARRELCRLGDQPACARLGPTAGPRTLDP